MFCVNVGSGERSVDFVNLGNNGIKVVFLLLFCFCHGEMTLSSGLVGRVENRSLVNAGTWKYLEIRDTRMK